MRIDFRYIAFVIICIAWLAFLVLSNVGCTDISYGNVHYRTFLQKKEFDNLKLRKLEDGTVEFEFDKGTSETSEAVGIVLDKILPLVPR